MHRTIRLIPEAHGTPVALQNAAGEWVEVGYVSDLEFTLDEADLMAPGPPWRPYRDYSMHMDVDANDRAYELLVEIAQGVLAQETGGPVD